MASRDGNGGGLGGFVWSYHGGDEGIMVLMCSTLLRLEPIGRLAQANSAPELHQARRGGRSLRLATKHSQINLRHVSGQGTCWELPATCCQACLRPENLLGTSSNLLSGQQPNKL
ncbi:hypothetical protein OsJ_22071 [Oryza sativa Japonica Group]|uniref:Uncharacterized protein n=1 Tax=Oryza sativa subsp. japonica TaxID=39947 RepID=A3BDU2_ORYSJ|nr:hypothetical protein OsJ_22071 [Oryza sativa Japonica Group]